MRSPIVVRLPCREPFDAAGLLDFLGRRAVPGVEERVGDTYRRVLALPGGPAVAALTPARDHVRCELRLADPRDREAAVDRCRRLLDLDADPVAIAATLGRDPLLGALVRAAPGRRVPGAVDGAELAVRAVLGQQVSVAGARRLAGRLTETFGTPLAAAPTPAARPAPAAPPTTAPAAPPAPALAAPPALTHAFPTAAAIAAADPAELPLTRARARALVGLCAALADGSLALDPRADRAAARERLLALPGIGPWTAEYVAMRALGDRDAFPAADLAVRRALAALGHPDRPAAIAAAAERWRPLRAYAVVHLWASRAGTPAPPVRPPRAGARR